MNQDPLNINAVLQDWLEQQRRMATAMNANASADFWQGYNNSKLNWEQKGTKVPYAKPGQLAKVTYSFDTPNPWVTITVGPELCVDPLPQDPWDIPPPPPPDPPGTVWFYSMGDDPYTYAGGGIGVDVGDIRTNPNNGRRYVYVESRGPVGYFHGWRLVG